MHAATLMVVGNGWAPHNHKTAGETLPFAPPCLLLRLLKISTPLPSLMHQTTCTKPQSCAPAPLLPHTCVACAVVEAHVCALVSLQLPTLNQRLDGADARACVQWGGDAIHLVSALFKFKGCTCAYMMESWGRAKANQHAIEALQQQADLLSATCTLTPTRCKHEDRLVCVCRDLLHREALAHHRADRHLSTWHTQQQQWRGRSSQRQTWSLHAQPRKGLGLCCLMVAVVMLP